MPRKYKIPMEGDLAVLEAASELDHEVEDTTETPSKTESESYSRNLKLAKWLEILRGVRS